MKNNIFKSLLCAAMVLGLAASVQAASITGEVDMSGTTTLNSMSLGSASAATAFTGVTVGGTPTGNFAGSAGTSVVWSGFTWPSAITVSPLWTFVFGGNVFSFDLTSDSVVSQSDSFLNLLGTGTLHETGFTDTAGSWSFTISNPTGGSHANFEFTFANSQVAALPDGGTTVMLLGVALSGLALIRRKLA